jgi:MoxR-like ATPase
MQTSQDIQALNERIYIESSFVDKLRSETSKVLIGQQNMLDRLMLGVITNGHILLEGMPGLAKTLAIKTLASAVNANFSRIQFTPDLLPADIVGTMIYNPAQNQFTVKKGPIFTNFLLADEINRAPAKVQSALLEAMQERQVTIGDETFKLADPFLVLATQNPIEQEGTYPLPEAQTDRFMMKVKIGYPTKEEELQIMRLNSGAGFPDINQVASTHDILRARSIVREVYIDPKIEKYILDLVFATREPEKYKLPKLKPLIQFGASPRASISLILAAKGQAFIKRRGFVIPDDIRTIANDVLRHRIGITFEAEAENIDSDAIINEIIGAIEVP